MPIQSTSAGGGASVLARLVPMVAMRDYSISDSSIVIGSSETADLRDTDRSVQPRHARLSNEAGCWYLEDLNSASGTFLNGQRVEGRARVVHGDTLRCGTSALELRYQLAACAATEAPHDAAEHELDQLREWIAALERSLAARDARIVELNAEVDSLRAELGSVRGELARSREPHEAAIAELRHQLAREHQELTAMSALCRTRDRELMENQALVTELRQVIDSRQAEEGHG